VRLPSRPGILFWFHHHKPAKRCSSFQAESFRLRQHVPTCSKTFNETFNDFFNNGAMNRQFMGGPRNGLNPCKMSVKTALKGSVSVLTGTGGRIKP